MIDPSRVDAELRVLPKRCQNSHKGDFGRILIVAGSYGMHGAAALSAAAAFAAGAGLVTVACPDSIYPIVGSLESRATYCPLPETTEGLGVEAATVLQPHLSGADVVVIGPGMGTAPATSQFIHDIVQQTKQPLILDADGLNAFQGRPALIGGHRQATIVTPHPGELARLTGKPTGADDDERRIAAIDLAMRVAGIVVLKGHRSVITNGMETFFNSSGNPGMATAGAGDVLTGCIAATLAVVREPMLATRLAVYAHGLAGDLAAAQIGQHGLTATELLSQLGLAIQHLEEPDRTESPGEDASRS